MMSNYERLQIDSILGTSPSGQFAPGSIEKGVGLVLLPVGEDGENVHRIAIEPALDTNGVNVREIRLAFDETALLSSVVDWARRAEIVIAIYPALTPRSYMCWGCVTACAVARY